MSLAPVTSDADEVARVEAWRLYCLLEVGYSEVQASALAAKPSVDLHYAIELVKERGCPPLTATAILL